MKKQWRESATWMADLGQNARDQGETCEKVNITNSTCSTEVSKQFPHHFLIFCGCFMTISLVLKITILDFGIHFRDIKTYGNVHKKLVNDVEIVWQLR